MDGKFREIITPILYLLIAFLAGASVAVNFLPSKKISPANPQLYKLNEVMNYIDKYYVDSVDVDSIYDNAINAILQGLDPHSSYSTPAQNKAMMEALEGSFEGIGIQFNIMNDTVMVISTISGGPSEKAGVRAGDRIVTVDGKSFVGASNEKVFKALRGKKGTHVKVGVLRPGFDEVYTYDIKRDVIPTYTVDVAYMVDKKTGYIKLNEFGSTTAEEFAKALQKLKGQGMQQLIVDLRGNAGGFLDAAISVCDELLANKRKIVSVEGLNVRPEVYFATRRGNFETGKVAILIDDFSASASEIVAGAVQDNDRGHVIGRRSFGKGLVQRQFNLNDESTIRLTTARYHTPSGRCIQRDYKEGTEAYYEELYQRIINGEMESEDSIKLDKSKAYKTVGGRTVYGGGGIMPDYFVPLQRLDETPGYSEVANTAALVQYAFHYVTQNKADLKKKYANAKAFVDNFQVSDAQLTEMLGYYKKLSGHNAPTLTAKDRKELKIWTKAYIGRNLYGEEAFYPVINTTDNTVQKALEVMK
ncbi:MAG: S41 family peptidase [Bacteroidales bacterium]|nr:S41 family peptidase [Bacteroidales bacterium]